MASNRFLVMPVYYLSEGFRHTGSVFGAKIAILDPKKLPTEFLLRCELCVFGVHHLIIRSNNCVSKCESAS